MFSSCYVRKPLKEKFSYQCAYLKDSSIKTIILIPSCIFPWQKVTQNSIKCVSLLVFLFQMQLILAFVTIYFK